MNMRPTNAGVILALLPSREYIEVRPTIIDHHTTVLYFGKYDDPRITDQKLQDFLGNLMMLWPNKIKAHVTAETVFNTPDGWAHVDLINGPMLPDFRSISQELAEVHGLPIGRDHGFLPHITRRYIQSPNPVEMIHRGYRVNFSYDRVAVWAGDTRYERNLD